MLQFTPIIVAGGLGAVDDALENADINAGRTANNQQRSFWYELAIFGVPAFMEISGGGGLGYGLRWLADPALLVGSALLGRRAAKWARTQGIVPSGYAVPAARGYSMPVAQPSGFVNKQPSFQLV
jgi:hypothetical protein